MIILLFGAVGTTTLETEIYQNARGMLDFSRAGILAVTETLLAALFVALYSSLEQKAARTRGVTFAQGHRRKTVRGGAERCFFALVSILIVLFFLAPLAGIAGNAFSSAKEALTLATFVRMVRLGLTDLITGAAGLKQMTGVVGIVDMMAETGEQAASTADAFYSIFYLTAFIAVNLTIMNMLPIPALDGGRVFLLLVTWLIESVTHKKLNPKYEGYIHAAGMVLLLGLMAFIMFHDIVRLFTK